MLKRFYLLSICLLTSIGSFATPPPADEVFQLRALTLDANTFLLEWHMKRGYFIYQQRIKIVPQSKSNFTIGALQFPESIQKTFPQGASYAVYRNQVTLPVSILGDQSGEGLLDVHFQGCADDGFCYPPQTSQIKVSIDQNLALSQVNIETPAPVFDEQSPGINDQFSKLFSGHRWPIILLVFFGFGLLLAFTPCILPMVPVLSGIIVGHGNTLSTRKAFLLSLSYVISMSLTYALIGAMVALMGSNLQVIMQSPWAISLFSLIFVVLALSMFDLYELRMPSSWQAKFASITRQNATGHYLGAALMGCFSTLILSPCVTAPLIGALAYIAQDGDIILGSLALFFLGLGMGTPLILVGMSAGKLLPKAGHWMNAIKFIFGVMLLATAIYLLQRILPGPLTMCLWGSLCIFSGIFSGGIQKAENKHDKLRQSVGLILLCYGILILIGASQGNSDPLQPLVSANKLNESDIIQGSHVKATSLAQVKQTLTSAHGKPVVLDFYADWCTSCKHIETTTLQNPQVKAALAGFIVVKVDLTQNNKDSKILLHHFNVVAPPTMLLFDQNGQEIHQLRLVGSITPADLYRALNSVLTH